MIYVTGSINTDMVIECPYIPAEGETLTGGGFMTNGGGKGANQAVACAKLGGRVAMCGAVGADDFGRARVRELAAVGVDTAHIASIAGVPSGIAVILVSNRNNRIVLDRGANAALTTAAIDRFLAGAQAGDVYLTQLENPIEIIGYGLRRAKEKGMLTVLNPAPADPAISAYFPYVDMLTPNETELAIFGGRESLFAAGIRTVVTTLGKRGYEIADAAGATIYPCIDVPVVDTTAAGDTFCGGMCVGLSEGMTLVDACAFGSKAASLACRYRGAQQSIPTRAETDAFPA